MLTRIALASAISISAVVLIASQASACPGDGDTAGGGIDYGVECPGDAGDDPDGPNGGGGGDETGTPIGTKSPYELCMDEYGSEFVCTGLPPIALPKDVVDPDIPDAAALAQSAKGRIDFKAPRIALSPIPPNPALVNLQTWLWLEAENWAPLEGSVTAGDTTVTATARPVSVRWNMGESSKVCQGPGTPWRKGLGQNAKTTCGFTYRHPSVGQPGGAFRISATVLYDSSWTCEGDCTEDGGDLGLLPSPTAATNLRVTERQTVVE